jgi:two-component system NarL family response regulator
VTAVRVLIVDDQALFREALATLLEVQPEIEVVGEAGDGEQAVRLCADLRPDVVLMDLRMPEMEGVEAVRRIRELDPQARVIVLTTYDADEDIARALQAGAKAYILKDIAADALVACVREVLAGKTYLAPTAAAKLAERVTQVQLTPRELAALRLLANGQSNKEIATSLGISERTVKTHLAHLFEKLGVTSRTEAVRVATRRGLVRFD